MILWIILVLFTSVVAVLAAAPILRHYKKSRSTRTVSLANHKNQQAEAESKKQAGIIDAAEAGLAQIEIERSILDSNKSHGARSPEIRPIWQIQATIAVSSFVVIGSIGLYASNGNPQLSTTPALPQTQTAVEALQRNLQETTDTIDAMVRRLEAKLNANPNDADGWRILGWSYYNMERYKDAVDAYRRSSELRKNSAILKSLYGEALVKAGGGVVTAKASAAFAAALGLDPNDVRGQFFTGLAMEQKSNPQGALSIWTELLKTAPADAEWAVDLRERIAALAIETGTNISTSMLVTKRPNALEVAQATPAPKGPSAEDVKNAEKMSQEDRMVMVRGKIQRLADRLKESPDDPDGWIRLIRSRLVLLDNKAAHAALSNAMTVFADRPQTQNRIKNAATALGLRME